MQKKMMKEEEFEQIYEAHRHDVYKLALYFTQDEYTAEDIAQKIFYKLFLHFDNVRCKENILPYLLKMTRNMSYNWIRHRDFEYRGEYIDNMPEDRIVLESAEEHYLKKEKELRIREFWNRVLVEMVEENESWYNIITLIYCLGKTHEEVAEELDMTMQVLYSKFYRARRWIRKNYENEYLEIVGGKIE